jgi:4-cresol dehydrogenase (hydroxylating) flavoprotein subunit
LPITTDFVQALAQAIGASNVHVDADTIERLSRSTGPERTTPIGAVRPANREEVRQIVRLASRFGVPLFPISRGKNWGYGDACAPTDRNLILDLSRMNRIIEVNKELAYAVVEPGVTQGQLFDYLEANQLELMLDVTGAGRGASILGNFIERGSGHTPYADHFATSCNYEVVLPDGSVMETGFGPYRNAQARHVYKWGIGPSLDGLFSQSNFGIVTRVTIWLMPKPDKLVMFIVTLKQRDSVGPLFEAVRRLRLLGTLRSAVHCFNDRRLLGAVSHFPWDRATGRRALEIENPELFLRMCREYGISAWAMTGSLQGSAAEVAASRRVVRKALRSIPGVDRLLFFDEGLFAASQTVGRMMSHLGASSRVLRRLESVRIGRDMLLGKPSDATLKGSHWRSRTQHDEALDPLESEAGLAWISPILPMTSAAIAEVSELSEGVFHQHGFEYQTTITAITDRALIAVQSISYDRSSVEETARAGQCQDDLLRALLDRGYVPYRGPVSVMRHVWNAAQGYWEQVSSLKRIWDKDGVIAPGRYVPSPH